MFYVVLIRVLIAVPRTVLKERYESAPEEDEVAHDASDLEHDEVGEYLFGVLFTDIQAI